MYAKFSGLIKSDVHQQKKGNDFQRKLKQYHHIRLDGEFKRDCAVWLKFLDTSLYQSVNWPMVDILGQLTTSEEIAFYSDASAAETLGFGCLLEERWIQKFWENGFIERYKPSIKFLELFALAAGIFTWQNQPHLTNCRVVVFCDNTAVMQMINDMMSSCPHCMVLIRKLVLNGLQYNRRLSAKYVNTRDNFLSDALSRGQWKRFWSLGPHMNELPDEISEEIWPASKLWDFA